MSAIAALWRLEGPPDAGPAIDRMSAALAIYGPDASGRWDDGTVGLAARRLNLLPEDRFDRQPVRGGDGTLRLVADLRLDNREELGADLALSPQRLAGMADGQLLMSAYERWGEDCVAHLDGDFAFVLWDGARRRMFCARDHLGSRPLFVHRSSTLLAVATMPKGLFALPEIPRRLDEVRLAGHLALLPGVGQSFYRDIAPLPAGHCLSAGPEEHRLRCYWRPDPERRVVLASDGEYLEAFRALLDQSVRCRLRSSRPIGSHLSGGLDSSTVTVTAARLLAAEGRRLTAFTAVPRAGFDGPTLGGRPGDEGPAAAGIAADWANIDHVRVAPGERSSFDEMDLGYLVYESPLPNPCNIGWVHGIGRAAAAQGIGVMLRGAGGNHSISYDGMPLLPALLREGRLPAWLAEVAGLVGRGRRLRGALAASIFPYLPSALWQKINQWRGRDWDLSAISAIDPAFAATIDIQAKARAAEYDLSYRPPRDGRLQRVGAIARADPACFRTGFRAAFRIDLRDPCLDRRLFEFCLAIPEDQFLRRGQTKWLLRRAMADALPAPVLHSPKKGYQAADWYEGLTALRDEVRAELRLLEQSPLARQCLDLPRLQRLAEGWPSGGWDLEPVVGAYRHALLRGIATGRFIRRVEGGNG